MKRELHRRDLPVLRSRLGEERAEQFWRSLEELAGAEPPEPPPVQPGADPFTMADDAGRRRFLQLMGASLGLAGMGACVEQPTELIVPYVRQPEDLVPGRPLFYATATTQKGYARGVLVESHMGRPTKVEGNPEHPESAGGTDAPSQASVWTLYDPDRSQAITHLGDIRPWGGFVTAMQVALGAQRAVRGAGLRILTGTVTSPTLAASIEAILAALPEARWHVHEPAAGTGEREGARLVFGEDVDLRYDLRAADVIVSLGADLLDPTEGTLAYARDFAARRRTGPGLPPMNRLYVVESMPTLMGAKADHRLPLRPAEIDSFARALARGVGVDVAGDATPPEAVPEAWLRAVVADLSRHRGRSLVVAGAYEPPAVHALACAMNAALGNVGVTLHATEPVAARPATPTQSLADLAREMEAGQVQALVIVGSNPVYTAPADVPFAELMKRVPLRVHSGLYHDETAFHCHWHVPEAHYLETWGDARSADGTATIQQPLIAPLFGGRSPLEVFATLTDRPERSAHDQVRDHWAGRWGEQQAERRFRRALHDGVVPDTAARPRQVSPRSLGAALAADPPRPAAELELLLRPDPFLLDGRDANNAWLQELPQPLTKHTWDNTAWLSPLTAGMLGVASEDVVEISFEGRVLRAPVTVMPGQADRVVTVHLGRGRTRAGSIGNRTGYDAYALRTTASPFRVAGVGVVRTGDRHPIATTQGHHRMEGRQLVRVADVGEYQKNPEVFHEMVHEPPAGTSMFPPHPYPSYAWGMTIDMSACTGCSACVVACQAENNVPVVGKDQVRRGREMHWLRIDRYFEGPPENPRIHFQPILCMHCETAPCEVVCPVTATAHSVEGLNDMVYNRCVGTRYCSNNCPYKVRRFNFYGYAENPAETMKMLANPDVTVRTRGVMEKCTYCVQRISHARIQSKKEDRRIRDGEIMTACQAACPARAIVFGDINDGASAVARQKAEKRNYGLLTELNTLPRTTYLGALRNPNPEIEGG